MFHQKSARPWYAMGVAIALAATPLAAQQGSAAPKAPAPAPAPAADSAKQPVHKSRFARFGRAFEKAASTAAAAGSRAGLTKETAARLAVTAATGGAAAALMGARQQSALSAATLASRALAAPSAAPLTSPPTAASMAAARARLATWTVDTATAAAAVRALTELGQISVRAQQHDPAAMHAMQVLNAAMAKPDAVFVALQQRATAGDPSAAQQIIIREDAIARAALGGGKP